MCVCGGGGGGGGGGEGGYRTYLMAALSPVVQN